MAKVDQIVPNVDKTRIHTRWNMGDIYNGTPQGGRFVPNPDDEVWSWAEGLFRVVSVNYETCLSVLERHSDQNINSGLKDDDVLLSSKPGSPAASFRIYVNTSVLPHVMNFDNFLHVYGTNSRYLKIFRGTDVSSKGDVISAQFNSSGIMESENILFETVQEPDKTIRAIKTPMSGFVTHTLTEGEIVTAVIYGANGNVLSVSTLVTVITNAVRTIDSSKKQISDISLITPFLSSTDNLLVEVPINLMVDSMPMTVKVTYTDGSNSTYPLGDDRVALHGIENFVSSEMGYTADLVLVYTLAEGEYSTLVQTNGDRSFLSKPYRLRTIDADSGYQVKLFVIPRWDFITNAWTLDYYMYTLDRDVVYNVTPFIEQSTISMPFDGRLFNKGQNINVAVNLSKVNNKYTNYRHAVSFNITLLQAGGNIGSEGYYLLEYSNQHIVGSRATAKVNESGNLYTMDISQGLNNGGSILDNLFWNTAPLYYEYAEAQAPAPTHVRIKLGANWNRTIPVDELKNIITDMDVSQGDVRQGSLVRLEFYRQTQTGILELGSTALTVQR